MGITNVGKGKQSMSGLASGQRSRAAPLWLAPPHAAKAILLGAIMQTPELNEAAGKPWSVSGSSCAS